MFRLLSVPPGKNQSYWQYFLTLEHGHFLMFMNMIKTCTLLRVRELWQLKQKNISLLRATLSLFLLEPGTGMVQHKTQLCVISLSNDRGTTTGALTGKIGIAVTMREKREVVLTMRACTIFCVNG